MTGNPRGRPRKKAIGDLNLNISLDQVPKKPEVENEPENEAVRELEAILKDIENAEGSSWQLERLLPISFQGIPTRGFIEAIPYSGSMPNFNEIKKLHGGGKYLLHLRDSGGRFMAVNGKGLKIIKEITGPPNISEMTDSRKPQVEQLPVARQSNPDSSLIAIMQEQSKSQMMMMMEFIKQSNTQLMTLITTFAPLMMQNKGPDVASYLEKAADLLDAAGGLDGIRGLLGNNSGADSPVQQLAAVAASFLENKIDKKKNPAENKALSEVTEMTELPDGLEEVK